MIPDRIGTSSLERSRLRDLTPWLITVAALLAVGFWTTGQWMYVRWTGVNSYYTHGFLIPPVSVFFLWLKREQLARCAWRPSRWGWALLLPSLLLHLTGVAWQVGFFSGFALLGILAGLTLLLFGREVLRIAAFPIAFLVFMVPLPFELVDKLSFNMKLLAAGAATKLVQLLGVVAVREGSNVYLETGPLTVDDVCSGLKYLISLMAFAALYAHLSKARLWGKIVLFALSIPIAFAANAVRVMLMILVGRYVSLESTQAWYFHDFFGFVLFVVAFVTLFLVESLMLGELRRTRRASGDTGNETDERAETNEPVDSRPGPVPVGGWCNRAVLAGVLVLAAAASVYLVWPRGAAPATDTLSRIPLAFGPWQGTEYELSERTIEVLGTSDAMTRRYRRADGASVSLLIVMARQARRRSHPPEHCLRGEGYRIVAARTGHASVPTGKETRDLPVRELHLEKNGQAWLSWYFFKSGDHVNTNYWVHQAGVALRKFRDPNAVDILVRLETMVPGGDIEAARATLKSFLDQAGPSLFTHLP